MTQTMTRRFPVKRQVWASGKVTFFGSCLRRILHGGRPKLRAEPTLVPDSFPPNTSRRGECISIHHTPHTHPLVFIFLFPQLSFFLHHFLFSDMFISFFPSFSFCYVCEVSSSLPEYFGFLWLSGSGWGMTENDSGGLIHLGYFVHGKIIHRWCSVQSGSMGVCVEVLVCPCVPCENQKATEQSCSLKKIKTAKWRWILVCVCVSWLLDVDEWHDTI